MKILLDDVKLTLLLETKETIYRNPHCMGQYPVCCLFFDVCTACYISRHSLSIRNCTENRLRNARIDLYRKKHP